MSAPHSIDLAAERTVSMVLMHTIITLTRSLAESIESEAVIDDVVALLLDTATSTTVPAHAEEVPPNDTAAVIERTQRRAREIALVIGVAARTEGSQARPKN